MNQQSVTINPQQCQHLGDVFKRLKKEPGQRAFVATPLDTETRLRMFLFPVAICHQQHTLISNTRNLVGQDYLEHVFLNLALRHSPILDPAYLSTIPLDTLIRELKTLFTDDAPEHSPMDRVEERAQFLKEVGAFFVHNHHGSLSEMVNEAQGYLRNNGNGIYEQLDHIETFHDPSKKKSTLFVKLLLESGLLILKDPEHLIPPMDYHIQRVLLRTGSITVADPLLETKLKQKELLESDEAVRLASIDAVRAIARSAGKTVLEVDDMLWQLGRSCCKEFMLCVDHKCNKSPCTFAQTFALSSHEHCVLQNVCPGATNAAFRSYWQPIVETHYY